MDHAALIRTKVEANLTAQRIYQDLKLESSFTGSYQSVKRYVLTLRAGDPKLVHRIEVQPAEEVQVDFGTGLSWLGPEGKNIKTWIFRVVPSHSRKAYCEAVLRQHTEVFIRCLENAFREFGGTAMTLKYWRLKYHFQGRERKLALGVYPDVGIAEARERRAQARTALKAGRDC